MNDEDFGADSLVLDLRNSEKSDLECIPDELKVGLCF